MDPITNDNLGERLVHLLGRSDDTDEFAELLSELDNRPRITNRSAVRDYDLDNAGLVLSYAPRRRCFLGITFLFSTRSIIEGAIKPYKWSLPFGINSTDNRSDVERTLGLKPTAVSSTRTAVDSNCPSEDCGPESGHWEKYDRPPYRFIFAFDSPTGVLNLWAIWLDEKTARSYPVTGSVDQSA